MSSDTEKTALSGPPKNEVPELTEVWTNELFGCLSDWRLCCATFCCPCYTVARNAMHFGEDGMMIGLLACLGFMPMFGSVLRWRLRQERKLQGTMMTDVLVHSFLPCCALIQENKEIYGATGSHAGEQVPVNVEIQRK